MARSIGPSRRPGRVWGLPRAGAAGLLAGVWAMLGGCAASSPAWEPAPALVGVDTDGQAVTLEQYTGKVVLIDFWATWCAPCLASHPNLQAIGSRFRDEPRLAILAVHVDDSGDPAEYLARNGYEARLIPRGQEAARAYGVSALPTFVLIDDRGGVVHRHVGTLTDESRDRLIADIRRLLLRS